MPSIRRITIVELTPCADTILYMKRDPDEGYASAADDEISFKSRIRVRPQVGGTYAGGKATNVARTIDKLLGPESGVDVELIVFRPETPEGRYIAELQALALGRVRIRPVIIDGSARFCINLSDPSAPPPWQAEFNISPRVFWRAPSLDSVREAAQGLETDLLVLAGNPPVIVPGNEVAVGLPALIAESAPGSAYFSVDLEKGALAECLKAARRPDVIKINKDEQKSVDGDLWSRYSGTLAVTDAFGCTVWESGPDGPSTRVNAAPVDVVYSTVGAGDAAHAGLTVAKWLWGFDTPSAVRYGLAAAAAAVSSKDGTRGITKGAVDRFYAEMAGRPPEPG